MVLALRVVGLGLEGHCLDLALNVVGLGLSLSLEGQALALALKVIALALWVVVLLTSLTVIERNWLTVNKICHLCDSNKEQIALFSSAGATLGYNIDENNLNKLCPSPLQVDLWPSDIKVVSESSMTWATSVPILVFLGLSVLELGLMYAMDRQTSDAHHRVMPLPQWRGHNKLCGRPPQYAPALCRLIFDLSTLKVVSESRVTWATSLPILVFLGLSVLEICPMYATDRQTSDAHHRLMPLP